MKERREEGERVRATWRNWCVKERRERERVERGRERESDMEKLRQARA